MKLRKALFSVFLFLAITNAKAFSAMPIFHVYIAEKWMENFEEYNEPEQKAFLIGTLFPDIRYLGVLTRGETHEPGVTIDDLMMTDDPFLKGKRLHSFVDETRSRVIHELGIMDRLNGLPIENKVTFLKVLEDEILYSQKNWSTICTYLEDIDSSESEYPIPLRAIKNWHSILTMYFSNKPSKLLAQLSLFDLGFLNISKEEVKIWKNLVPILSKDDAIQAYVSILIEEFESAFKDFEHPL